MSYLWVAKIVGTISWYFVHFCFSGEMEDEILQYRHIIHFLLKKKMANMRLNTCNKLCFVYGQGAASLCLCQKWFVKFWSGDYKQSINSTRLIRIQWRGLVENPCVTFRWIACDLQISSIIKVSGICWLRLLIKSWTK